MSLRAPFRALAKEAVTKLVRALEYAGIVAQPAHYYASLPSRRWLRRHPDLWSKPLTLHGVSWNLDAQLSWLEIHCAPYLSEVAGLDRYRRAAAAGYGPGFGPIESQVLHGVMRSSQPAQVLEVGSGVSTALMLEAAQMNDLEGGKLPHITCIEPNPSDLLQRNEQVQLIDRPVQAVEPALFQDLSPGDLLFIDSSHAVRTGSELPFLYLEVLPRLREGVLVQIHDIYLPYTFSPWVQTSLWDWQETTLLAAMVTANPNRYKVRCALSALHSERTAELQQLFPDYRPADTIGGLASNPSLSEHHYPASTYLEIEKD